MSKDNAINAATSSHVQTMGKNLGMLFFTLWQHTTRTYIEYVTYEALYAHSQARFDLLNCTRPFGKESFSASRGSQDQCLPGAARVSSRT